MTTESVNPNGAAKKRSRSPAYPLLPLEEAIIRARRLWDAQRKHPAQIDAVLGSLGYKAQSGTALRTIAALNHYGLTDETGVGEGRRISVSERAQDIIHLHESDPRRIEALKAAALAPGIFKDLWERYGKSLPPDQSIVPFLIRDKGYNEAAVSELIGNYRKTFEFAKLGDLSDTSPATVGGGGLPAAGGQGGQETPTPREPKMTTTELQQELPVLVANGRIARIPFPMTEDDFSLLLGTLNLWKKRLVKPKEPTEQESS